MELLPVFKLMADKQASDLFFSVDAPIQIKIEGNFVSVNSQKLTSAHMKRLAYGLMTPAQINDFEHEWEMNFGYPVHGLGNFRVNIFRQRGEIAMVIRFVRKDIPSLQALNLPPVITQLAMEKRGIIMMVGATGSGKSSTLAAMLEYRNTTSAGHILTMEDPIEFIFEHKKCLVNQREVGIDTKTFGAALKNAMREAPDVLMIGEIRDRDTMQHALTYAQSGHMCLSTLHATNSYQALNRVINFFPHDARSSLLMDLSVSLKAIVSQRLVRGLDGKRVPAIEILLNSNHIADLIKQGEVGEVKMAMEHSMFKGTQTFEQALYKLFRAGKISQQEALDNSDSPNNLSWLINNSATVEELDLARANQKTGTKKPEAAPAASESDEVAFDIKVMDLD